MAVTVTQFRSDFPAFSDTTAYPDTQVQFWITFAANLVGANWGAAQDQGTELLVAHYLFVGPTSVAGGGTTGGGVTGPVASKQIKDVSVSYATSVGLEDGAGFFNASEYGRIWWSLRNLFGIGPIHLSGADFSGFYEQPGTSIYPLGGLS